MGGLEPCKDFGELVYRRPGGHAAGSEAAASGRAAAPVNGERRRATSGPQASLCSDRGSVAGFSSLFIYFVCVCYVMV